MVCDAPRDVVQHRIVGLRREGERPAEVHVLVALADRELRREDDVAFVKGVRVFDHLVDERFQNDVIRPDREVRSVLFRRRHGQQHDRLVLIEGGELVS